MKITVLVENELAEHPSNLRAEFGLSLHIEHGGQHILFDTGATGAAVVNAERLGIDLGAVDAVVLSHHHFDHGGGLPAFFAVNDHAKVFLRSPPEGKPTFRAFRVVSRHIGLEAGLLDRFRERFVFVDTFRQVLPAVFILTDIVRQHDLPQGNRYLYLKQADGYVRDPFGHELVLAIWDDDGLAVFTGCGHGGVLNMIATVARHLPTDRIKAVVGGFHLVGLPLLDTMAASKLDMVKLGHDLLELPVAAYWTGHCTGHQAYAVLKGVLGGRLGEFHTGTILVV